MAQAITTRILELQNLAFGGTGGVSQGNWTLGFIPGFLDRNTGLIYIARRADGSPAPCHLLDGLPEELVRVRDTAGEVRCVKESVIAGFVREGRFYTREQAADAVG